MKRNALAIILVGIVAALIVAFQWAYCYGNDNFSLIQVDGKPYKVFRYGFPFMITDANAITGINTCLLYTSLLVAGTAYCQHMLGAPGKDAYREHVSGYGAGKSVLGFTISGGEEAKEISEFFNVPLPLRANPGYNLLASFTPAKPAFDLGEEVSAILRIRNAGTNTIVFQQGGRWYGRDTQYEFSAQYKGKPVEDIGGDSGLGGGAGGTRRLEPGDEWEDTVSLSQWFAFDRPGVYEICGSYYLPFLDPADIFASWIIWDDYVAANFSVKIRVRDKGI